MIKATENMFIITDKEVLFVKKGDVIKEKWLIESYNYEKKIEEILRKQKIKIKGGYEDAIRN